MCWEHGGTPELGWERRGRGGRQPQGEAGADSLRRLGVAGGEFGDKTILSRAESRSRVPEALVAGASQGTVGGFVWLEN